MFSKCGNWLLTIDAPLLLRSLEKLELDPWLCRVHLLDWSQNRVYDVTLPKEVSWPSSKKPRHENKNVGKKCIGVAYNSPSFAVKVVCNDQMFQHELGVLSAVAPSFFICGVSYDGVISGDASCLSTTEAANAQEARARKAVGSDEGWWSKKFYSQGCESQQGGGVLIMKVGENVPDLEDFNHNLRCDVVNDCLAVLRSVHQEGYCHTDLRLPNVLKFNGKYTPVDFGEAVLVGAEVCVDDFSEGRKKLLADASSSRPGRKMEWHKEHDVEMLMRAVFDIPVSGMSHEEDSSVEQLS
jgi:hypothetical protein